MGILVKLIIYINNKRHMDRSKIGPLVVKIVIAIASAIAGAFGWSLTV